MLHRPSGVRSLDAARDSIELANAYLGHALMPGQELVLEAGMGERADGSWAAATVCHFGGRQGAGKNETVIARELAGLRLFGEQLMLHTAHEFKTANESFLRIVSIFENFDDLRRLVARVRYANGEQGIEFLSGQRLKFLARTGGAGRGFAGVDLLVLDEAQHLQPEHLAASGPTLLANPNAQAWAMGSGGLATSQVAWRWRRQALEGRGDRFAYVEFTAEQVRLVDGKIVTSFVDPMDRDGWAAAMPAYGRHVGDEQVLQLYDLLGPEMFTREGLCVWDPEPGTDTGWLEISFDDWQECHDDKSGPLDPVCFAVDVAEDRGWAAIGVSGRSGRGGTHVEITYDHAEGCYDYRPGTGWVADRAKALHGKWGRPFAVVKGSPAWSLEHELRTANVALVEVNSAEFAQACAGFYDDARHHTLKHLGQPALTAAVSGLAKRPVGGDAFVWDRRRAGLDISPAVAVTLARWGAITDEGPKQSGLVDPNTYEEDDW